MRHGLKTTKNWTVAYNFIGGTHFQSDQNISKQNANTT